MLSTIGSMVISNSISDECYPLYPLKPIFLHFSYDVVVALGCGYSFTTTLGIKVIDLILKSIQGVILNVMVY